MTATGTHTVRSDAAHEPGGTGDPGRWDDESRRLHAAAQQGAAGDQYGYAAHLVGRGRVDDALPWLEQAARGGEAGAARLRAVVARDRGQLSVAGYWYRTAADRDGDCAFGLAELLWKRLEDLEGAAEWYATGAALGSVKCRTDGALLMLARGRTDEARAELALAAPHDEVAERIEERLGTLSGWIARCRADVAELSAQFALPPEERTADLAERLARLLEDEEPEGPRAALDADPEWFRAFPSFLPEAEEVYREARALDDPRTDVRHALLHWHLGRYEDACRVLAEALVRHPGSRLLTRALADIHFGQGRREEYETVLTAGAEAGDPDLQFRLGGTCLSQGRLTEARRWLEAAAAGLADDPGYGEDAVAEVAGRLAELAEKERARPAAPSAAEQQRVTGLRAAAEDGDAGAHLELGRLAGKARRWTEATRHYRSAAAVPDDPRAATASYELGRMLHEECYADESAIVPLYLAAARAGDLDATEALGALHVRSDRPEQAEPWLRKAARFGRPEAAAWVGNRAGDVYGDMEEAIRWWTRAAKGGSVFHGWRAGKQLVLRRRYEEAETPLRLAWSGRADNAPLHEAAYWLGCAAKGRGRTGEAVEWLRTACEVHPVVRQGYSGFLLATLFDPAVDLAELLVVRVAPEAGDAAGDGTAAGEAGQHGSADNDDAEEAYAEAEALLAPVLEHTPRHATAHYLLGRIAERRGDQETARFHLDQGQSPDDGEQPHRMREAVSLADTLRHVTA